MSTIILKVDLQCCKCNKKIRNVLCGLQDRWNIQAIIYDEKNGAVTVSGNFDPEKLIKKLCCKACKVIKEIEIKKPEPPKADPPPPPPPPPEEVPAPAPPPPDPVPPPPEEPPKPVEEPPKPVEEPPKPAPPPQEETAKPAPEPVEEPKPAPPPQEEPKLAPPALQYLFYGPACCCWYHGVCRCCSCGRAAAYALAPPPCPPVAPPVGYGVPYYEGYKTYELISEEDRSCRIM